MWRFVYYTIVGIETAHPCFWAASSSEYSLHYTYIVDVFFVSLLYYLFCIFIIVFVPLSSQAIDARCHGSLVTPFRKEDDLHLENNIDVEDFEVAPIAILIIIFFLLHFVQVVGVS